MKDFKSYMHVEKYGNDEVQGIELGTCYIFPKIDGTNGSVWLSDGEVCAGARKRKLLIDNDNRGFLAFIRAEKIYKEFLTEYPNLRLFGEWLVPHTLKAFRDIAWDKFYVFDVFDDDNEQYLDYETYRDMLKDFDIPYIPAQAVITNAAYDNLLREVKINKYLLQEDAEFGEGIVIKNYDYRNKYGRLCYAKIVSNVFKDKHIDEMGTPHKAGTKIIEQDIVDKFLTPDIIDKVYAKICNDQSGWNSKYIPRLLCTVYHDFVTEELWSIINKYKNPAIDFGRLYQLIIYEIKQQKRELF